MYNSKGLRRIASAAIVLLLVAVVGQSLASSGVTQSSVQPRGGLLAQTQPLRSTGASQEQSPVVGADQGAVNYTVLPNGNILGDPVEPGVSPSLEELTAIAKAKPKQQIDRSAVETEFDTIPIAGHVDAPDPVVQESIVGNLMPSPSRSWTGMNFFHGNGGAPPDTTGDVGPNHYVQMINSAYVVLNKSTGSVVAGPFDINTLWSNVGGPCYNNNDGDPIVLHDQIADRWILTQFTSSSPYNECIAVSQTSNPAGLYWVYSFQLHTTDFPDYPKFGVWPDGYYMGVNMFRNSVFQGTRPYVFERSKMLVGQGARWLSTTTALGNTQGLVIPSDLDGSTLPPAGAPNFFAQAAGSSLNIYKFKVDWTTTTNSTWTGPVSIPVAAYTQLCNSCIPQPNTSQSLDGIGDRLMYRVAYRNYGTYEAMAVAMNVNANNFAAVRWYEVRNPNTTPTLYQQGTFGNTTDHRWMGSPAMDRSGNLAIGYSIGSPSRYPSVAYAGRLVSDPLGQLSQGEAFIYGGQGSQVGVNRWGDYSQLSIDPSDDCTFWYTTEYNESFDWAWSTRIGSFTFPSCGPPPPNPATNTPVPSNTPTKTNTPLPTATKTNTSIPTATHTATRTFTAVPGQPTATRTFTAVPGQPTATRTATQVPGQPTATRTATLVPGQPTATRTFTAVPGQPTATYTTIPGPGQPTATHTVTAGETVTACNVQFPDVPSTHTFYQFVRCLACRSVLGGFSDGTFRPGNNITRGQLSKVVANAANFTETRGEHSFEDIAPGSTFHQFVERMYSRGIISGYACGGPGEPCVSGKPYFRPNANATRGQIAKIVSNAAGFSDDPGGQVYEDIAVGSTFHTWVNRLSSRGVISGYSCGGAGEPCGPGGLPYFRPVANATRGQVAKIVSNTFFPNCQTP